VQRHLDWDGCFNVRELGGLATADGRTTLNNRVVRADSLDDLTERGWRELQAHGVRTIVDLRNDDERLEPAELPDGVELVHLPLDRLDEDPDFWAEWMNGPQFSTPLYYGPFLERFPHSLNAVLDAIEAAPPGGVVFHCVGGRDRTGLVAIAVLAAAGVEPEAIAADYVLAAERAHTHDPTLEGFLAERGTSARKLVIELAGRLELDRPGLRARLVVE
jgi:protein tyrosine/serine phosphatase